MWPRIVHPLRREDHRHRSSSAARGRHHHLSVLPNAVQRRRRRDYSSRKITMRASTGLISATERFLICEFKVLITC